MISKWIQVVQTSTSPSTRLAALGEHITEMRPAPKIVLTQVRPTNTQAHPTGTVSNRGEESGWEPLQKVKSSNQRNERVG